VKAAPDLFEKRLDEGQLQVSEFGSLMGAVVKRHIRRQADEFLFLLPFGDDAAGILPDVIVIFLVLGGDLPGCLVGAVLAALS
jgi:hypothetical protein